MARELTKAFEEMWRGTLADAVRHVERTEPRGEHVVVVGPAPERAPPGDAEIEAAVRAAARRRSLGSRRRLRRRERLGVARRRALRGGYAPEACSALSRATHSRHTSLPENSLKLAVPPQNTQRLSTLVNRIAVRVDPDLDQVAGADAEMPAHLGGQYDPTELIDFPRNTGASSHGPDSDEDVSEPSVS